MNKYKKLKTMKHLKTFETFINEGKNDAPYFFQIQPRDKRVRDSGEDTHEVKVGKNDNLEDKEKEVLKDYHETGYFYILWKKGKNGYDNIKTNETLNKAIEK